LETGDFMFGRALNHPAQLFLERRYGEQFNPVDNVLLFPVMGSAVFDEAVYQMPWKVVENGLFWA
jgi:hypothetical protein